MHDVLVRIFLVIGISFSGISGFAMGNHPEKKGEKALAVPESSGGNTLPSQGFLKEGFSKVVKPLLPAVVNISTSKEVKVNDFPGSDLPPDSPLGDLFRHFFKEFNRHQKRHQKSRSLGSGFVIDYDKNSKTAYIVTNHHIIAEADEILVRLADEETVELKAEVVGTDERTDIALLKVKSSHAISSLTWGDSDAAEVGQWCIAIGNPFGLGSTVTSGIISSKGRQLPIADYVAGYLQTDAPINMGNSGGPLLTVTGKVIGINTAILAPSGGNIGIGFSIPSNVAVKVIKQLKNLGHTRRGWLGAAVQEVTKEIAESVGLEKIKGALIARVFDKSPAKEAGLERGDVILKFNGEAVKNSHQLPHIVGETEIGKAVDVVIWRDEAEVKKTLTVGEFEKAEKAGLIDMGHRKKKNPQAQGVEVLDMTLQSLDDANRKKFNVDEKAKGVVIVDLDADSEAFARGLRVGDVISESGNVKVTSPENVSASLEEARKKNRKSILMLINRRGEYRFLTLATEVEKDKNKKKSRKKEPSSEDEKGTGPQEENSSDF